MRPLSFLGLFLAIALSAHAQTQPAEPPKGLVTGQVVDTSGNPVPNALVETDIDHSKPDVPPPTTQCDQSGRFQLKVPEDNVYFRYFWAKTPDGSLQGITDRYNETTDSWTHDIRITLKKARTFPITVKDAKGNPVQGATIIASQWFDELAKTQSDATGNATLRVPADASLKYIFAVKENVGLDYFVFWGPSQVTKDPYHLAPDFSGPVAFTLNGATPVTFHVVDEDQHPILNARVRPWYFDKPNKGEHLNRGWPDAITDARGETGFLYIPADNTGKVAFWVNCDGYTSAERWMWDPKSGANEVTATLQKMVHVTGKVLTQYGQPAAKVKVRVGGSGYQFDDFNKELDTQPDGSFALDVDPEKYYIFVAQDGQNVSLPARQLIHKSATPVEIKLQPGLRVFGKITAGPGDQPLAKLGITLYLRDDTYLKLPPDERFPGPVLGRKAISPSVSQYTYTDAQGNFELFTCPGKLQSDCSTSFDRNLQNFTLTSGSKELRVHFEPATPVEPRFHGRVVLADHPDVGVEKAELRGLPVDLGGHITRAYPEGTTHAGGNFELSRATSDIYLHAHTPDHKLAAVQLVKPTDDNITLQLLPTASAKGRLLDKDGNPLPNRKMRFGIHVGAPHGPFMLAFGDEIETAKDGAFEFHGLIPGQTYEFDHYDEIKNPAGDTQQTYHVLSRDKLTIPTPAPTDPLDLADITVTR